MSNTNAAWGRPFELNGTSVVTHEAYVHDVEALISIARRLAEMMGRTGEPLIPFEGGNVVHELDTFEKEYRA